MAKLPGFSYHNPDINYFIACSYYQLAQYENAIGYYTKVALNWPGRNVRSVHNGTVKNVCRHAPETKLAATAVVAAPAVMTLAVARIYYLVVLYGISDRSYDCAVSPRAEISC